MRRSRKIWIGGTVAAVGAALAGSIGYGVYLRSDAFRRSTEQRLTAFFGLPTDVAGVAPAGWRSRELIGIRMWLPDRRAMVVECPRAVWHAGSTNVLRLQDVVFTIGSEHWRKEDYERVLEAGFAHNFQELRIRQVVLERARVIWPRSDVQLTADGLNGEILFDETGTGQAKLDCRVLNGVAVSRPIRIDARVDPHVEHLLPEVTLDVPELPLPAIGLDRLLRTKVTQGTFEGNVILRQSSEGDEVELKGKLLNVRLDELTARMAGGPFPARVDLTVDHALIRDRQLQRVRFYGQVHELQVNPVLARLDIPALGGELRLVVYGAEFEKDFVRRFSAAGQWTGGSVEQFTEAVLRRQGIHGRMHVRLNALIIENNEIRSGDIDLTVSPGADGLASVDRELLLELLERHFGLSLPQQMLPQTIEFTHMGAKLLIDGKHVRLLAPQGPSGRGLITVKALGQTLPLLGETDLTFDLQPLLDLLQQHAGDIRRQLQDRLRHAPTSRPTTSAPR